MTEWKPLPDGLASDIGRLAVELRTLKDSSGLSLARLAERTLCSKSSWERYLNGKALPPQHAVTSLGKLADADFTRLLALWELANNAWHGHDDGDMPPVTSAKTAAEPSAPRADEPVPVATQSTPAPPTDSAPAGWRQTGVPSVGEHLQGRRKWAVIALGVCLVTGGVLFGVPGSGSGPHGKSDPAIATTRQLDVNCFADSCTGKNPKLAGCGGDSWTAALTESGSVYIELRYSDACKAAWARISWAKPGDIAQIVGPAGRKYEGKVHYATDNFSAMIAAPSPSEARACALLTTRVRFCTDPGGTQHLTEAPNPPTSTP